MPLIALVACGGEGSPGGWVAPSLGAPVQVVPGPGLPAEVVVQEANNNLSVVESDDGTLYFAWRTAPDHFASADVQMIVVSSTDGGTTWSLETVVDLDTDVREPQLFDYQGVVRLWFARLGTDPLDFEPGGAFVTVRRGPGDWSDPTPFGADGFIPWRTKVLDGRAHMIGYTGGENIYDQNGTPLEVHWLASDDGETWGPAVGQESVVHTGGASEADFAILDDGSLVAVLRNEAGEGNEFGSLVCTAPAGDLGTWTCDHDKRKFDSPLVFREVGQVWLVARRNVTETGFFDLDRDDMSARDQNYYYQAAYWVEPKRCALWHVDPATRSVEHVLDLPSAGDTCFPDELDLGGGVHEVWNYSSPLDDPDLSWVEGQHGPTHISRVSLDFGAAY